MIYMRCPTFLKRKEIRRKKDKKNMLEKIKLKMKTKKEMKEQ